MAKTQNKPNRRERERQGRIELILDNAEELFLQKGFAATTMNDIGNAAEFGRATLYHYFPSKEAIYVALVERAMDSLVAKARTAAAKPGDTFQKIERFKDVLLSFARRRKNFFRLYFITRFEALPYLDRRLAKRLELKTRELESIFYDIYREGARKGELISSDPLTIGDIFFAQLIGLMLLNSAEILEPPLAASVNKATRFFLDCIATEHT